MGINLIIKAANIGLKNIIMNPIPVIQRICGIQHHNNINSICTDTIGARSPE